MPQCFCAIRGVSPAGLGRTFLTSCSSPTRQQRPTGDARPGPTGPAFMTARASQHRAGEPAPRGKQGATRPFSAECERPSAVRGAPAADDLRARRLGARRQPQPQAIAGAEPAVSRTSVPRPYRAGDARLGKRSLDYSSRAARVAIAWARGPFVRSGRCRQCLRPEATLSGSARETTRRHPAPGLAQGMSGRALAPRSSPRSGAAPRSQKTRVSSRAAPSARLPAGRAPRTTVDPARCTASVVCTPSHGDWASRKAIPPPAPAVGESGWRNPQAPLR